MQQGAGGKGKGKACFVELWLLKVKVCANFVVIHIVNCDKENATKYARMAVKIIEDLLCSNSK